MNIREIKREFDKNKFAIASFVGFNYITTSVNVGETSKRLVNISVSYANALKKDIKYLESLSFDDENEAKWHKALINSAVLSYRKALVSELEYDASLQEKINEIDKKYQISQEEKAKHEAYSNGQKDAYIHLNNSLKWNVKEKMLYVVGFSVKKTVLTQGEQKEDTRGAMKKFKDVIRQNMKSSKFRVFKLENFQGNLRMNGTTLEIS